MAEPTSNDSSGISTESSEISTEIVTAATSEVAQAVMRLLPQLSTCTPPSAADLEEIVLSPNTTLILARAEGEIMGMLTLVTFKIPTGMRAWIEDVVVDVSARGKGVGGALTKAAVAQAKAKGARTVDLTSRPAREAANRLYQRVGFELRETNLYRIAT